MRTANERIEDLEQKVALMERDVQSIAGSVLWTADAVLTGLLESRKINYIEKRLALEKIELALTESLVLCPTILDQLKHSFWSVKHKGQGA